MGVVTKSYCSFDVTLTGVFYVALQRFQSPEGLTTSDNNDHDDDGAMKISI